MTLAMLETPLIAMFAGVSGLSRRVLLQYFADPLLFALVSFAAVVPLMLTLGVPSLAVSSMAAIAAIAVRHLVFEVHYGLSGPLMIPDDIALAAGIYAATFLLRATVVRGWLRPLVPANGLALRATATVGYIVFLRFVGYLLLTGRLA